MGWSPSPPLGEESLAECVLLAGESGSAPTRIVVECYSTLIIIMVGSPDVAAIILSVVLNYIPTAPHYYSSKVWAGKTD